MPVLFVSLEIAPPQLIAKSLARLSGGELSVADISGTALQADGMDARQESLSRAIRRYQQSIAPHVAFATATDAVEIGAMVSECEQMRKAKPVVFLDYVQALTDDTADADERLAIKGIVGALRHTVNSFEVPLFAISSVNRSSYDKPATGLSCLGGKQRGGILQRLRGVSRHRRQGGGAPLKHVTVNPAAQADDAQEPLWNLRRGNAYVRC